MADMLQKALKRPARSKEPVDVMIAQMNGETDPPPIAITIKQGAHTVIRVEMTPADFALCLTGRLVIGEITRGRGVVAAQVTEDTRHE